MPHPQFIHGFWHPKQAGQHRLNKINRHLRATSRVAMPLQQCPLLLNAPGCPLLLLLGVQRSKNSEVLLYEFWALGLWVLHAVGAYSTFDFNNDERSISCLSVFFSSSSARLLCCSFCSILLLSAMKISMLQAWKLLSFWALMLQRATGRLDWTMLCVAYL